MPSPQDVHGVAPTDREGWSRALLGLIAPATRVAALGPARLPVHAANHDPGSAWLESIARPLWGLAPLAAGGGTAPQWDEVRAALAAAVDPRGPWYIGEPVDRDQRIVESAAIGYALAAAPHEMWDPLSGVQRDNLAAWLGAAMRAEPVDNNWHFFPVYAATGLAAVGVPVDEGAKRAHLDRLEEFALADGWYADGPGAARDYYVPFGFHFYSLLLTRLGAVEEERAERFRERATRFAGQFRNWFAADGAGLPFGRSLGYRFAQGAFWSALAAADCEALPWAEVRGLAQRHLEWWWPKPVADEEGGLTVGYAYPNTGVVEQYMAGGSPYWGVKFFAALAAGSDHPFWTEKPAPVEGPAVLAQPAASMVLSRDGRGDVVALNGQETPAWRPRGGTAKYAKFAYSTLAGIGVPTGGPDLDDFGLDGTLALSDDGVHWRTRTHGVAELDGEAVVLRWRPWPDVTVETRLAFDGDGRHVRVHTISAGRALTVAEGGFCVPWNEVGAPGSAAGAGAAATAGGIRSEIVDVDGAREGLILHPMPGSHVLFGRTVLPALLGGIAAGDHVLRCAVTVRRV
ncbi:DUF2264 domain-containing protein [Hamadaea tsunoensis]|uniref:DUF2264 domain-containing protein n=1 Tax=Hamadaea tsunoensis TaxID=53368 RepID=UPI000418F485|nr:DUF2264 domain-containing protein [Hamadaea tsunoensis]